MSSPSDESPVPLRKVRRSDLFNDPTADVILVSSDQVQFRLHRFVLSLVSPVFKTMFSLPQGESTSTPAPRLSKVQMSESGAVLERLLTFWYPGVELPSTPFATISELAEFLEPIIFKYEMHSLIPASKMQLERLIVAEPLAGFAVAARYGWNDIALKAAKECLGLELRTSTCPLPMEQWRQAPATAFYALLQYHQGCSEAVTKMANIHSRSLSPSGAVLWASTCSECHQRNLRKTELVKTSWFGRALTKLTEHYERAPLLRRSDYPLVFAEIFLHTYCGCKECTNANYEATKKYIAENWWARIDAKIDAIELE
ncbi:hypothetical protein C8F01DRAFT_1054773, partial [Mycena amicta]